MNWPAQVWHVAKKDARQSWRELAAYSVGVVGATICALRATGEWNFALAILLPIAVWMLAVIGSAAVLHGDPPTEPTAFWIAKPIRPSSIVAAKLVTVFICLILLPLLGAALALWSLDARDTIVPTLSGAAYAYFEWLVIALVVAAFVRDMAKFVMTFVLTTVVFVIVGQVVARGRPAWMPSFALPLWAASGAEYAGMAGAIVLIFYLYRSRRRDWRTSTGGVIVVGLLLGALPLLVGSRADPLAITPIAPVASVRASLSRQSVSGPVLPLEIGVVVVPGAAAERLTLVGDTIVAHTRDGRTVVNASGTSAAPIYTPAFRTRPVIGWDNASAPALVGVGRQYTYALGEMRAVQRGLSSARVHGTVSAADPVIFAKLPLRAGASVTRQGIRVTLRSAREISGLPRLAVAATIAPQMLPNYVPDVNAMLDYAIVNERRGDGFMLARAQSGGAIFLVIPEVVVVHADDSLTTDGVNASPTQGATKPNPNARDSAWYAGEELVVIEWVPRGSFSFDVPVSLDSQHP